MPPFRRSPQHPARAREKFPERHACLRSRTPTTRNPTAPPPPNKSNGPAVPLGLLTIQVALRISIDFSASSYAQRNSLDVTMVPLTGFFLFSLEGGRAVRGEAIKNGVPPDLRTLIPALKKNVKINGPKSLH